jgi:flagellar hook-associated protein 1 FlgK
MADAFSIGVSALISAQRVMSTTGHNIANANTDGYSRQRVELEARPAQGGGGLFIGRGVQVATVLRIADQFLVSQLRGSVSGEQQASAYFGLARRITDIFGDFTLGASAAMQDFFDALQDVNDDPTSLTARQQLLDTAETMVGRFAAQQRRLDEVATEVNTQIRAGVDEINSIAQSLAKLNQEIAATAGRAGGEPNDLLDQRDRQLLRLAQLTNVTTGIQDDGQVTVTIGNGQLLVAGGTALKLGAVQNSLDASRLEISYQALGGAGIISDAITGGKLGGVLQLRDDMLEPARNGLGRIVAALALSFNAQHREGMDLNGALGQDFFDVGSPSVLAAPGNGGSVTLALDPANLGALTTADYRLEYDGSDFILTNLANGAQQTLSGAGPFSVDGLTIAIGAPPAAGDNYLLQPTKRLARTLDLRVDETREIAVARPVISAESINNIGSGRISPVEILNVTNPGLLAATSIVFNDPPTTFQINGAGPLIPYVEGGNVDVNGWRIQLSGSPAAGDRFTVSANTAGLGDNGNGLLLAGLQAIGFLEGGTATYQDGYGALIGSVGAQTRQAEVSSSALASLRTSAEAARQELSGVNLDEEAATLMRFQQAYEAAARVIQIGNDTMQALFDAMR